MYKRINKEPSVKRRKSISISGSFSGANKMSIRWLEMIVLIYVLAKGRAVPTLDSEDPLPEDELEDDPFADQENIFKNDINDNVENVHGAIKSDNQQKRVIMNSQDSYNKLEDHPVAMLGATSADKIDDNIKNAQELNQSDEHRKRTVLNNYDSTFAYHCKRGYSLSRITSVHDNRRGDRVWAVYCGVRLPSVGSSKWTFYVNDFDGFMNFECQDGNVVTGIGGYHSNYHEDRRFKFRCTYLISKRRKRCRWTPYTKLHALWSKDTPAGHYMTGVRSTHNNRYEDRQFSFLYCTFG